MRLTVLLCAVTIICAKETILNLDPKCDGVHVRGVFHRNEALAKGLNRPYQLSYHKAKNDIYFSNNVGNDTEDSFEIKRLDENGTITVISEVLNGFSTVIDEKEQVAYLGGSNGIYKLHLQHGNITHIDNFHNVWHMFYHNGLYVITYPSQRLYKVDKKKGKFQPDTNITEKIFQFAIDKDGDSFITNETGLYMIKKASNKRIFVEGETVFRAIVLNEDGEAHFCGQNHVYVIEKHKEVTLKPIAHIKNIFGLTFDKQGHIIYSNPHQIVRLLRSECKVVKNVVSYFPIP